jgi:hypothetical protein
MNALAPIAPRLAKLVALLSSDKDGEVLGAVEAMKRLLGTVDADFHDLARVVEGDDHRDTARRDDDWVDLIHRLLANAGSLSDRDYEFLRSMRRHVALGREPTLRQRNWILDIEAKLAERAA